MIVRPGLCYGDGCDSIIQHLDCRQFLAIDISLSFVDRKHDVLCRQIAFRGGLFVQGVGSACQTADGDAAAVIGREDVFLISIQTVFLYVQPTCPNRESCSWQGFECCAILLPDAYLGDLFVDKYRHVHCLFSEHVPGIDGQLVITRMDNGYFHPVLSFVECNDPVVSGDFTEDIFLRRRKFQTEISCFATDLHGSDDRTVPHCLVLYKGRRIITIQCRLFLAPVPGSADCYCTAGAGHFIILLVQIDDECTHPVIFPGSVYLAEPIGIRLCIGDRIEGNRTPL